MTMKSPLLAPIASMLPIPGEGGVGGIDVADMDNLLGHAQDDPADPANNYNPFYGKGTEMDSLKHASGTTCVCGHLWSQHYHQSTFGCKKDNPSCNCKSFKAKIADYPSEPSYRAAQVLAHFGKIEKHEIRRMASELDRAIEGENTPIEENIVPPSTKKADFGTWGDEEFRQELKDDNPGLDGYLYRSEVYCKPCGQELIDEVVDSGVVHPVVDDIDKWRTEDSETVPQPIYHLDFGMETCARCGKDVGTERTKIQEPGSFTPDDEKFLKDFHISMASAVPHNPLLKPPDLATATFFKESEAGKPKCPHCGSSDYALMPTDFETAKCDKCGKNWNHGIVKGINDPKTAVRKQPSYRYEHDVPFPTPDLKTEKLLEEFFPKLSEYITSFSGLTRCKVCDSYIDGPIPQIIDHFKKNHPEVLEGTIHSLGASVLASEKSYGMGQPIGGGGSQSDPEGPEVNPSPDPLQSAKPQPAQDQKPQPTTPTPAQTQQMTNDIVNQLSAKMGELQSRVEIHDSPESLPPRTELRKHLDESLVDDSGNPPIPLHKGADFTEEDEPDGEVTDLGTRYGQPLGGNANDGPLLCPICSEDWRGWDKLQKDEHTTYHLKVRDRETSRPHPMDKKIKRAPAFNKDDKEFLKGMGIKGSKQASGDAESWWKTTSADERRAHAAALGISKYWSHFVWDSLPLEVKSMVEKTIGNLSPLNLTNEDKGFLSDMKIQAGSKEAVAIEENINKNCPNCHSDDVKKVHDPDSKTSNIHECGGCGAFF